MQSKELKRNKKILVRLLTETALSGTLNYEQVVLLQSPDSYNFHHLRPLNGKPGVGGGTDNLFNLSITEKEAHKKIHEEIDSYDRPNYKLMVAIARKHNAIMLAPE